MSSYTKYNKAYYYKKVWKKEKDMMHAVCERVGDEGAKYVIDMFYGDFYFWLEWKGIDL